jgi:signal transduction histidine kinase
MAAIEQVSFTVDAGIINRLGLELVSKSETAVSELIKNAYDADANIVEIAFEGAKQIGGKLIIYDDGIGMTKEQLINGFMRLATTDKLHNSVSEIYKRPKAGKKGIGRFSTQRLGKKLTIITQTENNEFALRLTINWDDYETDKEIGDIKNNLEQIAKFEKKTSGTRLIIDDLRDAWSEADIKRVYRYVSELIQPNFLKVSDNAGIVEESKIEQFEPHFLAREHSQSEWKTIADPQVMVFDRALANFSGYIDENGYGYCSVDTKPFTNNGKKEIYKETMKVSNLPIEILKGSKIAFKAFYFIGGDRNSYYGIPKMELNSIIKYLKENGGIKLYRNGFRVVKYGDKGNDWLEINRNTKIGAGVPYNNERVLGFVQLTDSKGSIFEESAGREGLIEKKAFFEMQQFITSAMAQSFRMFADWFRKTDEYRVQNPTKTVTTTAAVQTTISELKGAVQTLTNPDATIEEKIEAETTTQSATNTLIKQVKAAADELEMLRVLAGVGLTIGEFVHEVKFLDDSLIGYINTLSTENISQSLKNDLESIKNIVFSLQTYTAYFDAAISQNVIRKLEPLDLRDVTDDFKKIVSSDLKRRNILLMIDAIGDGLVTCPMHISEWSTILQNLYSNAKKAIHRSEQSTGKILIKCYKDKDKKQVFLSFYDNGTGILEKNKDNIFEPFFTTYKPYSNSDNLSNEVTGTGLGLYILKQIVVSRNGKIWVDNPINDYKTCITIQLPLNI